MRGLPLFVGAALLFAGCATPAADLDPAAEAPLPALGRILPTGHTGGEPTLGILSDGTILMAGAFDTGSLSPQLLRSRDGGATWEVVGDPILGPKVDMDPWMWVDPDTDRAYHVPLYIGCSWAAWSDDGGDTWDANPTTGCGVPAHDHQKLTTGPPPPGVPTIGYPNVVYYAYNSFLVTGLAGFVTQPPVKHRLGTIVTVSLDGGRTYTPGTIAHESDDCHVGINGPVEVAPDGTAYLGKPTCEGIDVVVSRDAGQTWTRTAITSVGSLDDFAFNPILATDASGAAHVVFPAKDARVHLATTRDGGATWTDPVPVTPPEVLATVYSAIDATPEGALTIAYLGTTSDPSEWEQRASSFAPEGTIWNLYVTQTTDGVTFTTTQMTFDEDPVQRGCVWMRGGSNDCRNLLDFIDVKIHDGTAYISYTDGCVDCGDKGQSKDRELTLATLPAVPAPRTA